MHPFSQVLHQASLCEEIGGKLDGAAETSANHSCSNAPVETAHALGHVDFSQTIKRVSIFVLRAHGKEGRIRLQTSFHEEER